MQKDIERLCEIENDINERVKWTDFMLFKEDVRLNNVTKVDMHDLKQVMKTKVAWDEYTAHKAFTENIHRQLGQVEMTLETTTTTLTKNSGDLTEQFNKIRSSLEELGEK